jgi:hypothetical protein
MVVAVTSSTCAQDNVQGPYPQGWLRTPAHRRQTAQGPQACAVPHHPPRFCVPELTWLQLQAPWILIQLHQLQ